MQESSNPTSVIDIIDLFFGGAWGPASAENLSDSELTELAETVDEFYEQYQCPDSNDSQYRCYSGGATFMQPGNVSMPFMRSSILYAQQITINCPLGSWFSRRRGHFKVPESYISARFPGVKFDMSPPAANNSEGFWLSNMALSRTKVSNALALLADLEPAIRAGWVIPVPHLLYQKKAEEKIWTQVRHDIKDPRFQKILNQEWTTQPAVSDQMRGLYVEPNGGYRRQDALRARAEAPSLYFNGILSVADQSHSRVLPTADSDFALLQLKIQKALSMLDRNLREAVLVHSMDHVLAPQVDSDSIATIFEIRRDTSAFEDWRLALSSIISGKWLPPDISLNEAQALVVEQLSESIEGIRSEAKSSRSLGSRLTTSRSDLIDVGVSAALFLAGEGLLFKIMGLAPLLKVALDSFRPTVHGRTSVLLQLDRARVIAEGPN